MLNKISDFWFLNRGLIIGWLTILVLLYFVGGCTYKGYQHIDELKEVSPSVWKEQGFEPVAYEGYQMGSGFMFTDYGSAIVWWRLRHPDTNVNYSGYIKKWGDEYHVYGPRAIDAIKHN